MQAGVSFELGGGWREGVRDTEPPEGRSCCAFDECTSRMILKLVSLLEHQGKNQAQALQCSSPCARKSGACACTCVHLHLPRPRHPRVLLRLAHASKQQQAVVGVAESSSTYQRQQRRACGAVDGYVAIAGVLVPSYRYSLCLNARVQDWRGDTERVCFSFPMMYGLCGPTRYASSVGFKTSVSLGSGTV